MDEERHEVYERVPWETLERRSGDRQWVIYAVAGAVVVAALGYTFVRNRQVLPQEGQIAAPIATQPVLTIAVPAAPAVSMSAPILVSEADLYAVDPERLIDRAAAHAEWFAVEYFSVDGSAQSGQALARLMPSGIPLPEAPEGDQVFVDWVGVVAIEETAPLLYDVEVAVRSLHSGGDGQFTRQPTRMAIVTVSLDETGDPRVTAPPVVSATTLPEAEPMELVQLPADLQARMEAEYGVVVGGAPHPGGGWRVVVMVAGADGVVRPASILVG